MVPVLGLLWAAMGVAIIVYAPRLARQTWVYRRRPGPVKAALASAGFQLAGSGFLAGGLALAVGSLVGALT
jgi:hypothetical protein